MLCRIVAEGLREAWDGIRLRDMPDGVRLATWVTVGLLWGIGLGQLLGAVLPW